MESRINRGLRKRICSIALLALVISACATPPPSGSEPVRFPPPQNVSRAELQDDLMRFEGNFSELLRNSFLKLENNKNLEIRTRALANHLLYASSALDIAIGPQPESNLLDMVAFIELSKQVYEDFWMPEVFGSEGKPALRAFERASQEIWAIAAKVLSFQNLELLDRVIREWRKRHPNQVAVEAVRLSRFSVVTGQIAEAEQKQLGGLLANISAGVRTADAAVLLGQRALYYAQRAPFLYRLQARVGVGNMMSDALTQFSELPDVLQDDQKIQTLFSEIQKSLRLGQMTLTDANLTLASLNDLMDRAERNPELMKLGNQALESLTRLVEEWNRAVQSGNYQKGVSEMAAVAARTENDLTLLLRRVFWLGLAFVVASAVILVAAGLTYRAIAFRMDSRRRTSR